MKKLMFYGITICILFLCMEVGTRIYLFVAREIVNTSQENIAFLYYPNLKNKLNNYEYDEEKINLLILGGSVVFEDTIPFYKNDSLYKIPMCGFKSFDTATYNILNLAYPGHTSLDSRFKMDFITDKKFDYLFIYHGINDTRSNNTVKENYDVNYTHMEFYDELACLRKHKEIRFVLSPYLIERLVMKIKKHLGCKQYIPKEFAEFLLEQNKDIEEKYFNLSCKFFTSLSFNRNFNYIVNEAIEKDIIPILSTYGYYQPGNYSYKNYMSGSLDYADKLFPTELYGSPNCVPSGIEKHNRIVVQLSRKYKSEVIFMNLEKTLPKSGVIFTDICHLTPEGCEIMYGEIKAKLNE